MNDMRAGYEPFACAPGLKLEAHERLSKVQFAQIEARLDRLELVIERLEKRIWVIVFGVAGVILAEAFQGLLHAAP